MTNPFPLHLRRLEAESIHIMREVVAEFRAPVMLYSIGKDSSAMLHVALKAFHPAPLPFPLLHVDTTWKFREMIAFRDETAAGSVSTCACTSIRTASPEASIRSLRAARFTPK